MSLRGPVQRDGAVTDAQFARLLEHDRTFEGMVAPSPPRHADAGLLTVLHRTAKQFGVSPWDVLASAQAQLELQRRAARDREAPRQAQERLAEAQAVCLLCEEARRVARGLGWPAPDGSCQHDTPGGLERPQRGAHSPDQAGSTPAPATICDVCDPYAAGPRVRWVRCATHAAAAWVPLADRAVPQPAWPFAREAAWRAHFGLLAELAGVVLAWLTIGALPLLAMYLACRVVGLCS